MSMVTEAAAVGPLAIPQGIQATVVATPRPGEQYVTLPCAQLAAACSRMVAEGARLVTLFGDDLGERLRVTAVVARAGTLLALDADLDPADPRYPALTPKLPAAHWYERALHDLFGIVPEGHPWPAPLVLHEEWAGGIHPLRASFARGAAPHPDGAVWRPPTVKGEGVFEIPYGPVRSGVFESAQFLVWTAGEDILAMVPRMFYKHRGIEKLIAEVPLEQAVLVAEHASGVAAVAHSLAFCQAMERALEIEAPPRAARIRTICAELERLHNHLDSLMRQCETASLGVGQAQFGIVKERVLRLNAELVGNRFLRGVNRIGGVRRDFGPIQQRILADSLAQIERDFGKVLALFLGTTGMRDRLITTGRLSLETAEAFGAVGPVARGSGLARDVRLDRPYAAYDQVHVALQVQRAGDAMARTRVRIGEIKNSFAIIRETVEDLPEGTLTQLWSAVPAGARAIGWAEAPQGEVVYVVRLGEDGRLARCAMRSPSFCNWSFYERTMPRNVLTDVGFIEHSFALSQAGCDG
ncbi:MAG TPA: NADH-quinone oxidoreductase subunit C [Chloroflexota bacterium]|nr:NADH-quinone oxidoreductase subunit C [Chloroflexota bacterium]